MKKDSSKKMLFEAMHKVGGMPLNEENYSDYLDTNYSADGMEDANADNDTEEYVYKLYDLGAKAMEGAKNFDNENKERMIQVANGLRQEALRFGTSLGWGEAELPPYK